MTSFDPKPGITPLTILVVFFLSGMILQKWLRVSDIFLLLSGLYLIGIWFTFPGLRNLSVLLLVFLTGMSWLSGTSNPLAPALAAYGSIEQPAVARISSEPVDTRYGYRCIVRTSHIAGHPVQTGLLLYGTGNKPAYNDIISGTLRIRPLPVRSNPNQFDIEGWYRSRDVTAIASPADSLEIVPSGGWSLEKTAIDVRRWIRARLDRAFSTHAPMLQAMLLGERHRFQEGARQFRLAGLGHLLAVSGLHTAILAGVFYLILSILFRSMLVRNAALIPVLVLWGQLCHWNPSVLRAVIMIITFLVFRIMERRPNLNHVLALSVLVIVLIKPWTLFSPGLILSVSAVWALFNLSQPLMDLSGLQLNARESLKRKMLLFVPRTMLATFSILLVLTPLTLALFGEAELVGLLANIPALVVFSFLLPLVMLGVVMPYQQPFLWAAQGLSLILNDIAGFFSGFQLTLPLAMIGWWRLIAGCLLILAYWWLIRRKNWKAVTVLPFLFLLWFPTDGFEDHYRITSFDVGQGDCHLIESPGGETILIDTGPSQQRFESNVLPSFRSRGITHLDAVILTHGHDDHTGGMPAALKHLHPSEIIVSQWHTYEEDWNQLEKQLVDASCRITVLRDTIHLRLDQARLIILHPDNAYSNDNHNNHSLVCRFDYKEFSMLFTGDIETDAERYIMRRYDSLLDTDVLKVGHHGSETSSSLDFLEKTTPEYACISAREAFLSIDVVKRLETMGSGVFITSVDGAIEIETDGHSAWFKLWKENIVFTDNEL